MVDKLKENKNTILGEAFDAEVLCEIGEEFCGTNEIDNISLKVINFEDGDQLKNMLQYCQSEEHEEKLYGLLPYLTNEFDKTKPCTNKVGSDQMSRAYWSVAAYELGTLQIQVTRMVSRRCRNKGTYNGIFSIVITDRRLLSKLRFSFL